MNTTDLLQAARDPDATPFDYIVVGSGAGGGPLAARLAEEGCRVLVVEAGSDEIAQRGAGTTASTDLEAPLLHGKAVEDPGISWDFRVRHFEDVATQRRDTKSVPDPESPDQRPAINKPRTAALGGCTAHHALITAYGCDDAWEGIRALTGDDSWHPERMRRYFQRVENCQYRQPFTWIGKLWRRILAFFALKPEPILEGEHGRNGWLTTNVTDPSSALGDHQLLGVLAGAFAGAEKAVIAKIEALAKAIAAAKIDRYLDVNDAGMWRTNAEGVRLIPLSVRQGHRYGVRERLLDVAAKNPGRLVFATETHVTQLVFKEGGHEPVPRVVGVKWTAGRYLYKASRRHDQAKPGESGAYYARREVILAGGSFNTPQLLMLSGIGREEHLAEHGIKCRVNLRGVGENLQDRYEVCVVSELAREFSTLQGVNFDPHDADDPQLKAWRAGDAKSLYGSNGGALAILKKTRPDLDKPDIFMFAAPAMFRGYYPGWSDDLLRRPRHGSAPGETPDKPDRRNQLSWVILKARTTNKTGTVRLRSADPFATPIVTHHNFAEGAPAGSAAAKGAEADLDALTTAVTFARSLNAQLGEIQKSELWPGAKLADGSLDLREWIRHEAWGHHPCGTCRIGSDAWQPDPGTLKDAGAVLDTKFRVQGVRGLRVVDASVFPDIPGYFIVTPIYCISEKAADDILADFELYPKELESAEALAIEQRRAIAAVQDYDGDLPLAAAKIVRAAARQIAAKQAKANGAGAPEIPTKKRDAAELPDNTIGLALSGGGIRSATFCLGVLQGMAKLRRLREIDLMSTVSGGGFIGAFLGRLFQRPFANVQANPVIAVEQTLRDSSSAPLRWLRAQADYIDAAGKLDDHANVGIFLRNLLTIHAILGLFALGVFGVLRGVSDWIESYGLIELPEHYPWLSPWILLPLLILVAGVLPLGLGYWSAPRPQRHEAFSPVPLLTAIVLLVACSYGLTLPLWRPALLGTILAVVFSIVWLECARLGSVIPSYLLGRDGLKLSPGVVIRNRLSRALGACVGGLLVAILFVALDSLARRISFAATAPLERRHLFEGAGSLLAGAYAAFMAVSPLLRQANDPKAKSKKVSRLIGNVATGAAVFVIAAALLVAIDAVINEIFDGSATIGWWVAGFAALLSVVIARGFGFVNLSSLHATYASRLTRTFLGASNPDRISRRASVVSNDVNQAHPEDDVAFADYHPEQSGGPLHIVNACLNETIDYASLRDLSGRRGLSLASGPCGVSVGRRIHGLWTRDPRQRPALKPLVLSIDQYHVFRTRDGSPNRVESLTLGSWMAISGAAFSTGLGKRGTTSQSILNGLANIRLGYWWNTDPGHKAAQREKWPNLWQSLRQLPRRLYRVQSMLLEEFTARFHGANGRLWYLSDGGHFDNSGLYELIRRRVPFMIACDASISADLGSDNIASLVHLARVDFGAEIEVLAPDRKAGAGWQAFGAAAATIPAWIKGWIVPDQVGSAAELGEPGGRHAVLARITYPAPGRTTSWLLILKASLTNDEAPDVLAYKEDEPAFPQQSTLDQSYDETQWECYRWLGEHVALKALAANVPAVVPPAPPAPVAKGAPVASP